MRPLVALLLLGSVAVADSSVPQEGGSGSVASLSLERTACYGQCPIYKVTVLRDGTVQWEGEHFVKKVGKATAKLPPETMAKLADAFKAADFFALRDRYDNREMTDQPSAIVRFDDGKRKKTVEHYYGDGSAPKALTMLERQIDMLVGTARWIGRDK